MLLRIKQFTFEISAPYVAGTVLTEVEAQALNGLRAENIRNNFARRVEQIAGAAPDGLPGVEELARLQAELTEYEHKYAFVLRHESRRRPGVLALETRRVAEERVDAQVRAQGREVSAAEFDSLVVQFIADPATQEEARRRVAEREAIAGSGLEALL